MGQAYNGQPKRNVEAQWKWSGNSLDRRRKISPTLIRGVGESFVCSRDQDYSNCNKLEAVTATVKRLQEKATAEFVKFEYLDLVVDMCTNPDATSVTSEFKVCQILRDTLKRVFTASCKKYYSVSLHY